MKKLMIFLMAALVLTGTLLVSCNQNVGEDKLSSVTISEDMARSLSTSITTNVTPVDELTWYYQATKMDNGFFATGQTSGWTKVPGEGTGLVNKSLGKMSYGDWKFEFQGRDYTGETVYKVVFFCDGLYETINSDETMLTVPLAQGEGFDEAGIIFENLIFTLDGVDVNNTVKSGSTISSVQLVVTETGTQKSWIFYGEEYHAATEATDTEPAKPAYISFTPASTTRDKYTTSSSHPYRFAVKYNDNDIIEPFDFPVYIQLGYDMTISGDINAFEQQSEVTIEKTSETWTVQTAYTADKPAAQVSDMTATTDATPAKLADATSEGQTTVKAPSAALISANGYIDEGSTVANSVKVTVSSTETASVTFAATDGNAFAGIDLKLIRKVTASGSDPVIDVLESANFGDNNPVIVETYIAKGLTNVVLTYPAGSAAQPVASNDEEEIAEHKAHVMIASEAGDGTTLGYYAESGLLRFTTTHFSEFAVFADQYIFDKTTNMAYELDENGLLDGGEFNDDHEYILLDPAKANLVSDDIDVFNASKSNWTVLHDSSDVENTTDFAGGYGTKIEPWILETQTNFKNVGNFYDEEHTSPFYYWEVSDDVSEIDMTGWKMINLQGSIQGNDVTLKNMTAPLFGKGVFGEKTITVKNIKIEANIVKPGGWIGVVFNYQPGYSVLIDNVDVSGYVEGNAVSTYINQVYDGNLNVTIKDSESSITMFGADACGGMTGYIGMNSVDVTLNVVNSKYTGTMIRSSNSNFTYFGFNNNGNAHLTLTLDTESASADFTIKGETPEAKTYTGTWAELGNAKTVYTNESKKVVGSLTVTVDSNNKYVVAKGNSSRAVATLMVGPNPGNMYVGYYTEELLSDGDNWITDKLALFNITCDNSIPVGLASDGQSFNVHGADGNIHIANILVTEYDSQDNVINVGKYTIPESYYPDGRAY